MYTHTGIFNQGTRLRLSSLPQTYPKNGFTLIELSIVLVIIGLIVGGVLIGRDLISAATVRAQITQVEKVQTAVNTFRLKFNVLPGDMSASNASQFGFPTHYSDPPYVTAENGLIEGERSGDAAPNAQGNYETGMFWQDMASDVGGRLIDGNFTAVNTVACAVSTATNAGNCMLPAKINSTSYLYAYNDTSLNWLGLAAVISSSFDNGPAFNRAITVAQASSIDTKIDDGMPIVGNVNAAYVVSGGTIVLRGTTGLALNPTINPCYNNLNVAGDPVTYYMSLNAGKNVACMLSFRIR